jgi:hypothetical protein
MLVSFCTKNHKGLSGNNFSENSDTLFVADGELREGTKQFSGLRRNGEEQGDLDLNRSVFILGDNGSGKSSLIDALYCMTKLVVDGNWYCSGNLKADSTYRVILTISEEHLAEYEFTVTEHQTIAREKLSVMHKDDKEETLIFDRLHISANQTKLLDYSDDEKLFFMRTNEYSYWFSKLFTQTDFEKLSVIINCDNDDTFPLKANDLLLSGCIDYTYNWPFMYGIRDVYRFFENGIKFWSDIKDDSDFFSNSLFPVGLIDDVESMFSCAGYSELSLVLRKILRKSKSSNLFEKWDKEKIPNSIRELIRLYTMVAYAKQNDILLVMDDFGDNLSEKYVRNLVRLFLSEIKNESQLLATSHKESCLLSLDCLENDQFWIMEKGNLICLSEYKNVNKQNRLALWEQERFN